MTRTDRYNLVPEPFEEYNRNEVWPLKDIWNNEKEINEIVNYRIFENWAVRYRTNDFPQPAERVGRYNFYDPNQVLKWTRLWIKANRRLKANNGIKMMQERTRD